MAQSDHRFSDVYSSYEAGLRLLLEALGSDHARYSEALTYQLRLREAIDHTRRYGDAETRKAERAEVIDRLNELALAELGQSFNQLCDQVTPPTAPDHGVFEPPPPTATGAPVENGLRRLSRLIYNAVRALRPAHILFFILLLLALWLLYYTYSFMVIEARYVAPSFRRFCHGLPSTSEYGTNTRVMESQLYVNSDPLGPRWFLRLEFLMFCKGEDIDCNGGWILGNLRGYDASDYRNLVFEVRGGQGGEHFGVALKDTHLAEVKIDDVGRFVSNGGGLSTRWETVVVPLTEFRSRNIDLSSLQNLSFFVDARHTDQRQIRFDVANIRLEK